MPVTITGVQNGDGTATITVAGSGGAVTNTIYFVQVGTQWDSEQAWSSGGNRVGDGVVNVATGQGAFWFYLSGDDASVAVPIFLMVLSASSSTWIEILDAVQAKVRLLNLESASGTIASDQVEHFLILDEADVEGVMAGERILIVAGGSEALTTRGPIQRDDLEYPVTIAQVAPGNRDQSEANKKRWTRNRERIRKAFINQPLSIASGEVNRCGLRPLDPIVAAWWKRNFMVSPQTLVFDSRETRGVV